MKKLIFVLCIGLAATAVGCGMLKQSNAAHHAIEDQGYDVDKVVVKVKDGRKTVVVHTQMQVTKEDIKHIKAIVREKIPDAQKVTVQSPGGVVEGKPPVKGKPPVEGPPPVKGKPPAQPVEGPAPVKAEPPGQ